MHKSLIAAVAIAAIFAGSALAQTPPPPNGADRFFAVADGNHDGTVTRAEFDQAGATRFAQMDANHDGTIAVDERPAPPPGMSGPPPGPITRADFDAHGAEMFAHMDADHNGSVTQAEAAAMQAEMAGHH